LRNFTRRSEEENSCGVGGRKKRPMSYLRIFLPPGKRRDRARIAKKGRKKKATAQEGSRKRPLCSKKSSSGRRKTLRKVGLPLAGGTRSEKSRDRSSLSRKNKISFHLSSTSGEAIVRTWWAASSPNKHHPAKQARLPESSVGPQKPQNAGEGRGSGSGGKGKERGRDGGRCTLSPKKSMQGTPHASPPKKNCNHLEILLFQEEKKGNLLGGTRGGGGSSELTRETRRRLSRSQRKTPLRRRGRRTPHLIHYSKLCEN